MYKKIRNLFIYIVHTVYFQANKFIFATVTQVDNKRYPFTYMRRYIRSIEVCL